MSNKQIWVGLGILFGISALVYLPLTNKMGLYNDDWYLIYDAHTQGSQFFHEIYAIDRPMRAYVMQLAYDFFGDRVLYYHLSAYFFRILAAWALFWALEMIWTREEKSNFLIALLFLIYPGFLSQINPIDYQSQILSLCLAISSIAFTLKSIKSSGLYSKILWFGLSVITGVIYPALVDYFIGLEVLRLSLIVNLVLQEKHPQLKTTITKVFYQWIPFLIAPLTFLIWRVFFFTTERRATDLNTQLGQLFASPLTGLRWLVNWTQDMMRVLFLAWSVPLNSLGFNLRLGDFLWGVAMAALVSLLAIAGYYGFRISTTKDAMQEMDLIWRRQTLMTGILTAVFALLPVIIVNRHADFEGYSRYTLASAVGAAMFLTALITSLNSPRLRLAIVGFLVFVASFVHYANAVHAVQATEAIQKFWWQVAWRAPGIKPGTTLIASYSAIGIQEDYFVWGPANLIYYPEKQNGVPIEIRLPAAVLTNDVIVQILSQKGEESPLRRGNLLTRNFENILVLSQADTNSCVRIIDGHMTELSVLDQERIMLVAPSSKLENVLVQGDSPIPQRIVFGDEPVHDWCYYYQKASLARQREVWETVAALGDEAQKLGLHPNDQIEWMPFLQAYVILNDLKEVKGLSTRINTEPFYQYQACQNLNVLTEDGYPLSTEMRSAIDKFFCK